jgi:dihydroorotate dehydrogenase
VSALYSLADRVLLRPLGPDRGHQLALLGLRLGFFPTPRIADAFRWRGITFPNRVGVAAGFDKNAVAVAGLARIGAGFAEIGTILTQPWAGSPLRPRMARLEAEQGVWNRLGFPSDGLARVAARLGRAQRGDMVVACNIAPHPLTVRAASEPGFAARARAELDELVTALHPHAQLFVINLSSPNTSGLRGVLYGDGFAQELVAPTRARLAALAREAGRAPTPLLVKLPPETTERAAWSLDTLAPLVKPLAGTDVCDGFVATNTSIGLALARSPHARPDAPGGVSGAPLREHAVAAMRALRELARAEQLRIGVGGVMRGADARALVDAGAHLVELYSGMVYRGPGLIGECAAALRDAAARG